VYSGRNLSTEFLWPIPRNPLVYGDYHVQKIPPKDEHNLQRTATTSTKYILIFFCLQLMFPNMGVTSKTRREFVLCDMYLLVRPSHAP